MDLEKETICNEILLFSKEQRIEILKIIKKNNPDLIKIFPDGVRINLDLLSDQVILALYNKVRYIICP